MQQITLFLKKVFKFAWYKLILSVFVIFALIFGFLYWYNIGANNSWELAYPKVTHYHLRLVISIDGKLVNFGDKSFQEPYSKTICSGKLTDDPIHFHDSVDQVVHIHWQGISGGMLLKNYGLDYLGGNPDILGYRFDNLPELKSIPITAKILPKPADSDNLFVYTGDKDNFQKRSKDDFLQKDLEIFLKKSNLRQSNETVKSNIFSIPVGAHELDSKKSTSVEKSTIGLETSNNLLPIKSEKELEAINDLIGNIVIFIQKSEPNQQEIKDRFNNLTPLTDSVCGG